MRRRIPAKEKSGLATAKGRPKSWGILEKWSRKKKRKMKEHKPQNPRDLWLARALSIQQGFGKKPKERDLSWKTTQPTIAQQQQQKWTAANQLVTGNYAEKLYAREIVQYAGGADQARNFVKKPCLNKMTGSRNGNLVEGPGNLPVKKGGFVPIQERGQAILDQFPRQSE